MKRNCIVWLQLNTEEERNKGLDKIGRYITQKVKNRGHYYRR